MTGDLQRIQLYAPPHGDFQIAQRIPQEVWDAFELLTSEAVALSHPKYSMNLVAQKT